MDQSTPRAARLQALRDRWFQEPLRTSIPALADETPPATCNQYVQSFRMASAFSSLHDAPDVPGMTPEEAAARDRQVNAQQFGVEDPRTLMRQLSHEIDLAPGGQVEPDVLKNSAIVIDAVRKTNEELAAVESPLQAAHQADADAITQAQGIVTALASELGISLPLTIGRRRA